MRQHGSTNDETEFSQDELTGQLLAFPKKLVSQFCRSCYAIAEGHWGDDRAHRGSTQRKEGCGQRKAEAHHLEVAEEDAHRTGKQGAKVARRKR